MVARMDRESGEGISGHLGGRSVDAYLEGADSLTWPVKRMARGSSAMSSASLPQSSPDCEACHLTPSLAHRPSLHHPPDTLESQ